MREADGNYDNAFEGDAQRFVMLDRSSRCLLSVCNFLKRACCKELCNKRLGLVPRQRNTLE